MRGRYNLSVTSRSPRRTFLGDPIISRVALFASRDEMSVDSVLTNAVVGGKADWRKALAGNALLSRADAKRLGEALLAWAESKPAEWEDD